MRDLNYVKFILLSFLLISVTSTVFGQGVTFDNNARKADGAAVNPTINNFVAPAGQDRLLVVVFSASTSTNISLPVVSFGTDMLQQGASNQIANAFTTATYYLPLGTGAAITNDISLVINTGSVGDFQVINAFTLQFVDQGTPVESMVNQSAPSGTTTNLIVPGTTSGSMIIESLLYDPDNTFISITPESGQTIIDNTSLGFDGHIPLVSFLSAPGGDVSLDWTHDPGIREGAHTAMAFDFSGDVLLQANEMVSTNEDVSVRTSNVLTNNIDGAGQVNIPSPSTMSTQGGTVVFNGIDSTFTYTPIMNFNGTDTILYTVCNDMMPTPICVKDSVFVTVVPQNDRPTQGNENLSVNEDASTTSTTNVLANNTDVDGDPLTVTSPPTMSTQGGTVAFNTLDSTFAYTPILNFCGMDTIAYMVCDNSSLCVNDTVFVNVACVNDRPTQGNENLSITEDAPTTSTPNILTNNTDVDGDLLTVTNPPTTSTQGGMVAFNTADSTFAYTPLANFCGIDTLPYMVCDNGNLCVNDTVFVNIACVNDRPTQGNENLSVNEDASTTSTTNVLANNTDVDGDPLTVTSPPTMSTQGGTVTFNTLDSTFAYTPILNFCGMDTIAYMVCDNSSLCVNDTVFVNVACVNDRPTQGNENLSITEDAPTTSTPNVLTNNTDVDGDLLTVTSPPTTSTQGGMVTFNTADSTFAYTPLANFCGVDTIAYMVCDNGSLCVNDTVFINVACVNDAPLQGNENLNLDINDPTTPTPNVLANNTDPDGDAVTITSPPTMSRQGAIVNFNTTDSTFDYTPLADFCGMDTILYMVCDNTSLCVNDTVFVAIACANIPPVEPIPTMSQWGLLIFGLLVLNLALILARRMEKI